MNKGQTLHLSQSCSARCLSRSSPPPLKFLDCTRTARHSTRKHALFLACALIIKTR